MDDLFILAHLLSRFITWSVYEGEKKQNMQGNHKENTKEELICYICCEQTIQLEQRGMQRIWGIDPIACLTPKVGADLDRKLPLLGGLKIWLRFLCILYIDYRQYLPQGNMHQQSPQHPCEGNLQDAFCDYTDQSSATQRQRCCGSHHKAAPLSYTGEDRRKTHTGCVLHLPRIPGQPQMSLLTGLGYSFTT